MPKVWRKAGTPAPKEREAGLQVLGLWRNLQASPEEGLMSEVGTVKKNPFDTPIACIDREVRLELAKARVRKAFQTYLDAEQQAKKCLDFLCKCDAERMECEEAACPTRK
jgi:hypothetical protein